MLFPHNHHELLIYGLLLAQTDLHREDRGHAVVSTDGKFEEPL